MANKSLFQSIRGKLLPAAFARNREGAPAYAYTPRHKLAQLAVTGTVAPAFYASGKEQLDEALKAAAEVDAAFLAKTAIYARQKGYMKDMPALLLAVLSMRSTEHFKAAFPHVVDNGRMLRTFVQIVRSGATGRKSLGSALKRQVQAWLNTASDIEIVRAAVGNDPSLADIIKMVHPRPADPRREALYGYLIGKPHDAAKLPEIVQAFERFKADSTAPLPDVPFQMLTALNLDPLHWAAIARKAGWHMLRMNLNTFDRQCVFAIDGMAEVVARRLSDPEAIRHAKVFPYQLMAAHAMANRDIPKVVIKALEAAMETAMANVPAIDGEVVVCPDVSGSMTSPVTGFRKGATTAVRCVDVAALVAAAVKRKNPSARIIPFEQQVVDTDIDARDPVLANAAKLASIGGGGTNCSAPIAQLVKEQAMVDLVIFVSDNQSWVDAERGRGTALMQEWQMLKHINPYAKLVCIDIQPYGTTQVNESTDILNVGGFSDNVFEVVAKFADGSLSANHWVGEIEKIPLAMKE